MHLVLVSFSCRKCIYLWRSEVILTLSFVGNKMASIFKKFTILDKDLGMTRKLLLIEPFSALKAILRDKETNFGFVFFKLIPIILRRHLTGSGSISFILRGLFFWIRARHNFICFFVSYVKFWNAEPGLFSIQCKYIIQIEENYYNLAKCIWKVVCRYYQISLKM